MISVVDGDDFLASVGSMETTLALGAFLMIATAAVDIGKAVIFFPVLDRHGRRTAVAYLATMIFEMALMTVGVLALLMIIPLAEQAAAGELDGDIAQGLGSLAVDANETAYQIGQLSLAFGALFLAALLFRTGWCPGGWRAWVWSATRPTWSAPQPRSSGSPSGSCFSSPAPSSSSRCRHGCSSRGSIRRRTTDLPRPPATARAGDGRVVDGR